MGRKSESGHLTPTLVITKSNPQLFSRKSSTDQPLKIHSNYAFYNPAQLLGVMEWTPIIVIFDLLPPGRHDLTVRSPPPATLSEVPASLRTPFIICHLKPSHYWAFDAPKLGRRSNAKTLR